MKILHLSDLHIGRKLCEYPLLEEQRYVLQEIINLVKQERPQAVLVSGDVYDTSVPSAEASQLLDWFFSELDIEGLTLIVISGNHDSAQRLDFGSLRLKKTGLYMKGVFDGNFTPVSLFDEYGEVRFYPIPFFRRKEAEICYDRSFDDYTAAFCHVVSSLHLDQSVRNVALSHQFVTGAALSESESFSVVGNVESISVEAYAPFDYAALGHIHRAQQVRSPRLRYSGTPMKYSLSEVDHVKTVTMVTLGPKPSSEELCAIEVQEIPLKPLHDMIRKTGSFDELFNMPETEEFLYVRLTDAERIPNAIAMLRGKCPRILKVDYPNEKTDSLLPSEGKGKADITKTPLELIREFYAYTNNGQEMEEETAAILRQAVKEVWGENT